METCRICGKQLKNLNAHLRKTHNITRSTYNRKYPELDENLQKLLEAGEAHKCAICGKIVKNLGTHLIKRHKMTRAEYDEKYVEKKEPVIADEELLEEVSDIEELPTTVEAPNALDEKFDKEHILTSLSPEKTLSSFLEEYGITEQELRSFLDRTTIRSAKDVRAQIAKADKNARQIAKDVCMDDQVRTPFVEVAEVLIKEYGFRHIKTTSTPKKMWHLDKIKKK